MTITLPRAYQNADIRQADVTQTMTDLYNVVQQINAGFTPVPANPTFTSVVVTGATNLNTLAATGNTTLNTLSVSGNATLNTLSATGNATLNTLSASGNATLNTVSASGNTSLSTLTATGQVSLGGAAGSESLQIGAAAGGADGRVQITGGSSASTTFPRIEAISSSGSNTWLSLSSAGTSGIRLWTGSFAAEQVRINHTASAINRLEITGGAAGVPPIVSSNGTDTNIPIFITTKGTGNIVFTNTGNTVNFQINGMSPGQVNYLSVSPATTGASPQLLARGTDTNVGILLNTQGSGQYLFTTGGGSAFTQASIAHVASAVNSFQISGNIAGSAPTLAVTGTDTNIDLALSTKGTGAVKFGTLTANADAPVTGYITIKDAGGTLRKLAVIA